MYERIFQLQGRPFTAAPYVNHYFASYAIDQALTQAKMAIERATSPVILTGGTGTGKSLFLALLAEHFSDQFKVVNLTCSRLDNRLDLLQSILFELNQPYRDMSEGELRLGLIDFLRPSDQCPHGILLLVDEAHALNPDLLDELRLISNLVRDGQPQVRLVMAGGRQLEDHMNDPRLDSFNQRAITRCYLEPLTKQETTHYVRAHIDNVGGSGTTMFPDPTTARIHELCEGVPRLINQLCDHAMILAASVGSVVVEPDFIEEAWMDVQNIRGIATATESRSQHGSEIKDDSNVLEFGQLEEADDSTSDLDLTTIEPQEIDHPELDSLTMIDLNEMTVANPSAVTTPALDPTPGSTCPDESLEQSDEPWSFSETGYDQLLIEEDTLTNCLADEPATDSVELAIAEPPRASEDIPSEPAVEQPRIPAIAQTDETESAIRQHQTVTIKPDHATDETGTPISESCLNVDDPFDEAFDSEETVTDGYLPVISRQNLGSMTLSRDDLLAIVPNSFDTAQLRAPLSDPMYPGQDKDLLSNRENPMVAAGPIHPCHDHSVADQETEVGDHSADDTVPSTILQDQTSTASPEPTWNLDESTHDISALTQPNQPVASPGVAGEDVEANRVSSPLNPAIGDCVTASANEGEQPTIRCDSTGNIEDGCFETRHDLEEGVAAQAEDAGSEDGSSYTINYPVSNAGLLAPHSGNDDKDMLVLNQHEAIKNQTAGLDRQDVFPQIPSTGRAERMDYEELFQQLRNSDHPSQHE